MLMLTAYLDETGHSKDERQKFVGMGGLIATSKNWEQFEKSWKKIRKKYDVSCLHMKDYAHSEGEFKKWKGDEHKPIRKQFLGELMQVIKDANAYPFGCSIPLEFYRKHPKQLQDSIKDPYYFAFMLCGLVMSNYVEPFRVFGETIAPVFAEQSEFQGRAMQVYSGLRRDNVISDLIDSPAFRPMQKLEPLQAADFVAYEAKKETYRRLYEPNKEPRWGWKEFAVLSKISQDNQERTGFIFPSEANLDAFMKGIKLNIAHKILGTPKQ